MNTKLSILLIPLLLACFGVLRSAQAVNPAPDGGYPGFNTAEGQKALLSLTTGGGNTAIGSFSLLSNTDGSFNTGVGAGTLLFNVGDQSTGEGVENTAIGAAALLFNTIGYDNTAVGTQALFSNTDGAANTAAGYQALASNTTGFANTANGVNALRNNTTGARNTAVGINAGINVTTADDVITIGAFGANVSSSCYIGQIWNQTGGSQAVYVNSEGKLGAQVSSQRFKDDIKPLKQASEVIYRLRPVSFRYKSEIEPTRPLNFGLIAEEVEKLSADLVTRGKDGKPFTVRYDAVNAMLLNEFLKEHRKVEEQGTQLQEQDCRIAQQQATIARLESTVTRQQNGIEMLTAQLKQQEQQIQKVSAQMELAKPVAQFAGTISH